MSDINDNADDYIIHVEIVDAVGDGGTFYGDHVVTGDPFIDPPPNWEYGQLLFDGYDEDPTGGSDAGPHDHDYLPLAGGTLTGDLQVDGQILGRKGGQTSPSYSFAGDTEGLGFYASVPDQWLRFTTGGLWRLEVSESLVHVKPDLQVNGTITDVNGPVRSFAVADGIDTADVLDRAETAAMPVVDDKSVATTDAEVESLTVNEVVTALLAKVKQLSAEIEELKGN